jgi:hypothetical protein
MEERVPAGRERRCPSMYEPLLIGNWYEPALAPSLAFKRQAFLTREPCLSPEAPAGIPGGELRMSNGQERWRRQDVHRRMRRMKRRRQNVLRRCAGDGRVGNMFQAAGVRCPAGCARSGVGGRRRLAAAGGSSSDAPGRLRGQPAKYAKGAKEEMDVSRKGAEAPRGDTSGACL